MKKTGARKSPQRNTEIGIFLRVIDQPNSCRKNQVTESIGIPQRRRIISGILCAEGQRDDWQDTESGYIHISCVPHLTNIRIESGINRKLISIHILFVSLCMRVKQVGNIDTRWCRCVNCGEYIHAPCRKRENQGKYSDYGKKPFDAHF